MKDTVECECCCAEKLRNAVVKCILGDNFCGSVRRVGGWGKKEELNRTEDPGPITDVVVLEGQGRGRTETECLP